jgi:hypothetical protein
LSALDFRIGLSGWLRLGHQVRQHSHKANTLIQPICFDSLDKIVGAEIAEQQTGHYMACLNAGTVCGSRLSAKSAISLVKVILVAKTYLLHIFD